MPGPRHVPRHAEDNGAIQATMRSFLHFFNYLAKYSAASHFFSQKLNWVFKKKNRMCNIFGVERQIIVSLLLGVCISVKLHQSSFSYGTVDLSGTGVDFYFPIREMASLCAETLKMIFPDQTPFDGLNVVRTTRCTTPETSVVIKKKKWTADVMKCLTQHWLHISPEQQF